MCKFRNSSDQNWLPVLTSILDLVTTPRYTQTGMRRTYESLVINETPNLHVEQVIVPTDKWMDRTQLRLHLTIHSRNVCLEFQLVDADDHQCHHRRVLTNGHIIPCLTTRLRQLCRHIQTQRSITTVLPLFLAQWKWMLQHLLVIICMRTRNICRIGHDHRNPRNMKHLHISSRLRSRGLARIYTNETYRMTRLILQGEDPILLSTQLTREKTFRSLCRSAPEQAVHRQFQTNSNLNNHSVLRLLCGKNTALQTSDKGENLTASWTRHPPKSPMKMVPCKKQPLVMGA